MHDRCVVVGNAVVVGRLLGVVVSSVAVDVFELQADGSTAVTPGLLVEPTQCVPQLMHSRRELGAKQIN